MTPPQMQTSTKMFARVLGPFLVILDVVAIARTAEMRGVLSGFDANSLWAWVASSFVLLGGLIVIALHPYWRGAPAIIVSIVGWLVVVRGVFLLAFPNVFVSVAERVIDAQAWWQGVCLVFVGVGLYLTYVGWVPARKPPTTEAPSASDLPRAA